MSATNTYDPGRIWTSADLVFDPITHTSKLPTGVNVPHVTHILSATGLSTDFETLGEKSPRMKSSIDWARERGTAVHADCHAFDDSDLDLSDTHDDVRPYVEAWAACRERKRLTPLVRERRVFHRSFFYTGALDGIFIDDEQRRILIDIKTGDPSDAAANIQTHAYYEAYRSEHPDFVIDARWSVWLKPGRRVPYEIIDYTASPSAMWDGIVWNAALMVYRHQAARRLK